MKLPSDDDRVVEYQRRFGSNGQSVETRRWVSVFDPPTSELRRRSGYSNWTIGLWRNSRAEPFSCFSCKGGTNGFRCLYNFLSCSIGGTDPPNASRRTGSLSLATLEIPVIFVYLWSGLFRIPEQSHCPRISGILRIRSTWGILRRVLAGISRIRASCKGRRTILEFDSTELSVGLDFAIFHVGLIGPINYFLQP